MIRNQNTIIDGKLAATHARQADWTDYPYTILYIYLLYIKWY